MTLGINKGLNILHLSSERTWRGGEQQIAYLIEELDKKGIKNYVACRKNSAFENYCIENSLQHISLPFKNQFDIYTSWKIKSFCEAANIDIIHIHSSHSHAIAVWAGVLGNKTPLVLSRKVDFPIGKNLLSKIKYNFKTIKKIICVSDAIKIIVQQDIKVPVKCTTIHDGIDTSRFHGKTNKGILRAEFKIPSDRIIIGNISAVAPHKDYYTFVNVAEIIVKQGINAVFLIIGDGPLKNEIEDYITAKHLSEHIIMTGFRNDVVDIMHELDYFLMTSKTEGLGTTILDAFAGGIPVTATEAGGIPEAVIHEKTGLLAPIQNPQKLAKNLLRLIENPELRHKLIEGAKQKVLEFSKERMAEKTIEVYHSVLSK